MAALPCGRQGTDMSEFIGDLVTNFIGGNQPVLLGVALTLTFATWCVTRPTMFRRLVLRPANRSRWRRLAVLSLYLVMFIGGGSVSVTLTRMAQRWLVSTMYLATRLTSISPRNLGTGDT